MKTQKIVQDMVAAGLHFGDSKCHPRMSQYIYGRYNNKIIIDLFKTYKYLRNASRFLFNACRQGKRVLFIGTRKYISQCVEQNAEECDSWYINKRWPGGFLTNWETMKKSIFKLRTLNKKNRLFKYLKGVQTMSELPDIVIIIDQKKEINAVHECQTLKIPCITILDTNCDPNLTSLFIPANDDSLASINYILNNLSKAIRDGYALYNV